MLLSEANILRSSSLIVMERLRSAAGHEDQFLKPSTLTGEHSALRGLQLATPEPPIDLLLANARYDCGTYNYLLPFASNFTPSSTAWRKANDFDSKVQEINELVEHTHAKIREKQSALANDGKAFVSVTLSTPGAYNSGDLLSKLRTPRLRWVALR